MLCIHPCLCVCVSVCLSACLSVSRITQKVTDGFERNNMGRYPRTIPLHFVGDPDSRSGFRIRNIIFLKSLSPQSLFIREHERSEPLCGECP